MTVETALATETRYSSDPALICPKCGEETGLHIDTVELHSAGGQKLTAEAFGQDATGAIQIKLEAGAESPGRRHRIVLVSFCEQCGERSRISFEQHKGLTFFKVM